MPTSAHNTKKDPLALFCCIATVVMLAELSFIQRLSLPHGLAIAAIQHLMVIVFLSGLAYYSRSRFTLLLLVATAATGPFGAGICFVTAVVYAACRVDVTASPCQWIDSFFAHEKMQESDRVHERIAFGLDNISDSHIEPFQDILIGGTVLQKQMAIAKITQHFHPRFAPLLLQAVQDPNAAVRVQAATGLAKIEHDFMAKYLRNEKAFKNDAGQDPDRLQIAHLCDNYAHAGVLDEDSCSRLRAKAIEIYEAYLAHCNDPDRQLFLARLYLRQEQPQKTCQLLGDAVESGNTTAGAVLWYMEALFRLKKFAQLRKVAKHYAHMLKKFDGYKSPGEAKEALSIWGDESAYAA